MALRLPAIIGDHKEENHNKKASSAPIQEKSAYVLLYPKLEDMVAYNSDVTAYQQF